MFYQINRFFVINFLGSVYFAAKMAAAKGLVERIRK